MILLILLLSTVCAKLTNNDFKPSFDDSTTKEISVAMGQPVRLRCLVYNLVDPIMIMWIRKSDLHILTIEKLIYTADVRFDVRYSVLNHATTSVLILKESRLTDSGNYECQVNTEPKMSKTFTLNVTKEVKERPMEDSPLVDQDFNRSMLELSIYPKEQFAKKNSSVEFKCKVDRWNTNAIPTIRWLHDGHAWSRGGVSIVTTGVNSRLVVWNAGLEDAGEYRCAAGDVISEAAVLHFVADPMHQVYSKSGKSVMISKFWTTDTMFFVFHVMLLYYVNNCWFLVFYIK